MDEGTDARDILENKLLPLRRGAPGALLGGIPVGPGPPDGREPEAGSPEPGGGSWKPGAGSPEPGAGSWELGAGSREVGAGSREPGAGSLPWA